MSADDLRTVSLGTDSVRSVAWFSWQDDPLNREDDASSGPSGTPGPHDPVSAQRGNGDGSTSLSEERMAELRRWIAGGGHNSPDVAEQVARRILERGDA